MKVIAENLKVEYELELKKSVENADIVIISIPIHATSSMIEKIAPMMKENSLIFDISSLKLETSRILHEVHKIYPLTVYQFIRCLDQELII